MIKNITMLGKIKRLVYREFGKILAMLVVICIVIRQWNTAVEPRCPGVFEFPTECRIELQAVLRDKVDVTECALTINEHTALQRQSPVRTSYIIHIDHTCHVEKTFSHDDPDTILRYVSNIPKRTMVAGVLHNSEQLQPLYDDIALQSWFEEHKTAVGNTVFLMWAGYKGLLKGDVLTDSVTDVYLSDTVHFGTTFNYSPEPIEYSEVLSHHPDLDEGGHWRPTQCQPRWSVAIIIPYRNRQAHLWMFLENINRFLKLQQIEFTIFVVEQAQPQIFNRASLMNIGYLEAKKLGKFDCYVFHDVDMVPEDLANLYKCDDQPRHLVIARSVTGYRIKNDKNYVYFGGAIVLTPRVIEAINGFPNSIFGWGGEDDEIYGRIERQKYAILRYPAQIGTYYCFDHGEDEGNPHIRRNHLSLYKHARRSGYRDGLGSTTYDLLSLTREALYTNITVRIAGPKTRTELNRYNSGLTAGLIH